MDWIWRLRAAVLTLVGALVVHEGRYLAATPEHRHEMAGVHEYLTWVIAFGGVALFLALAQLAVRLDRRREAPGRLPGGGTIWLAASTSLLSIFVAQELGEVLLSHGSLPAPAEAFGPGAWVALPLAVACGGAIALLLKGAAAAVRWALSRGRHAPRSSARAARRPHVAVLAPMGSVLARRLAGRAPPALT